MPLVNEQFWQDRMGQSDPCWSGDRWLDWEHATVVRRMLRRIWPEPVVRAVDVGCGDGRWTVWIDGRYPKLMIKGTDMLEYPGVRENLPFRFVRADAERVHENSWLGRFAPSMVLSLNTITCVADWRAATESMRKLSGRYVLMFDNFQTPTPWWWNDLPHRRPIELPELIEDFEKAGWKVVRMVTGDVWHRRLFMVTPRWMHPVTAVVSAALDWIAAYTVRPINARHQGVLFEKGAE